MSCGVREDKIRGISDERLKYFSVMVGKEEQPRDDLCHNGLMQSLQ